MAARDPRNEAWARDRSRFGFAMLERMGWKAGEGLGPDGRAKGSSTHVKVVRRPDNRGVGASFGASAAEWAQGTQGLSDVLGRLARSCTPPPPPPPPAAAAAAEETKTTSQEEETTTTSTSEKKRGAPKTRVGRMRNMRNVRAKLAQRTEEETACVLLQGASSSSAAAAVAVDDEQTDEAADVGPITVSTVSSADYFRTKLKEKKKK